MVPVDSPPPRLESGRQVDKAPEEYTVAEIRQIAAHVEAGGVDALTAADRAAWEDHLFYEASLPPGTRKYIEQTEARVVSDPATGARLVDAVRRISMYRDWLPPARDGRSVRRCVMVRRGPERRSAGAAKRHAGGTTRRRASTASSSSGDDGPLPDAADSAASPPAQPPAARRGEIVKAGDLLVPIMRRLFQAEEADR